ncbi:MAG: MgtC/SapB family protein [Defluviitaleaceae bacterium]|nr:MgtC/SapB family protein [Defluviitaleaceae bacterium]
MNVTFVVNLTVAIMAGIIVGLERQWQHKIAGMRTTALVSFGACLFVTLSVFMAGDDSSPTRIAAQVVSGIGFLAGGVIIRDGFSVSGINTAAIIWCSAAIGSIIGAGYRLEGIVAACMLMFVNIVLRSLSRKVDNFLLSDSTHYYVSVKCGHEDEIKVRTKILHTLNALGLDFNQITCSSVKEGRVDILIDLEVNAHESSTPIRIKSLVEKLLTERRILQVHNIGADLEERGLTDKHE